VRLAFVVILVSLAGCSNAPIAGTLDTLFPSRPPLPRDQPIRPEGSGPRIPESPSLPEPDLPGRRLPPIESLPSSLPSNLPQNLPEEPGLPRLRPLDELPRSRSGELLPPPSFN
jgi:hypothetical protein